MIEHAAEQEIYLDHNATTPLDERVLEAMEPFLRGSFGNAASVQHGYGRTAAGAVEQAQDKTFALKIGSRAGNVIYLRRLGR